MLTTHSLSTHPLDLSGLVDAGDHACSLGDRSGLADVARLLRIELGRPLEPELLAIEQLAARDSDEARRRWASVARTLRDWVAAGLVHRH